MKKSPVFKSKTQIIKKLAKKHGLKTIKIKLAKVNPKDFIGFPLYNV